MKEFFMFTWEPLLFAACFLIFSLFSFYILVKYQRKPKDWKYHIVVVGWSVLFLVVVFLAVMAVYLFSTTVFS